MKSTLTHSALVLTALSALGLVACGAEDADTATSERPTGSARSAVTSCDGTETSQFTLVDSNITTSQTWSGTVYVQGELAAAADAILTIEPGTQVVMAQDSKLDFAANAGATMQADGSTQNPVRFCGEEAEAGYWAGLTLGASAESSLENVIIVDAGAEDGAALTLEGAVALQNVTIAGSAGDGVHAADFSAQSAGLSVEGSAGTGIVLEADSALAHFPANVTLSSNGEDRVRLSFDTISMDTTVHANVAYVQEGTVRVSNDAAFTLEAGVDYQMDSEASLEIGGSGEAATALFLGTEAAPVTFSGSVESSGSWRGIVIANSAGSASLLSNVEIRHAGNGGSAALDVQSVITLDQVLVTESNTGVRIGAQGLSAQSEGLTVTATTSAPLQIDANALVGLPDCELSGNADARIIVNGGAISASGTVVDFGLPYAVSGNIETTNGASLTIESGVEFVMADNTRVVIGADGSEATLIANGQSDAMIVFRGETDQAGSWYGLTIGGNVSADSSLSYVEIRNAGAGLMLGAALTLETAIAVNNSVFVDSAGSGILKATSDESDYASANTFAGVETEVAVATEATLEQ